MEAPVSTNSKHVKMQEPDINACIPSSRHIRGADSLTDRAGNGVHISTSHCTDT